MKTIGIAGAGGLGSNIAVYLVRAGVNRFRIVDFDTVHVSNLNRQFFFRDQIGDVKVRALKENLLRIDPKAQIDAVEAFVDEHNLHELFGDCDIVVEAFDKAETKAMLVSAFAGTGKFVVAASGVAGLNIERLKRTVKFGNVSLIGDGNSDVKDYRLYSTKVAIASAMMANAILEYLGFPDEK